MYLFQGLPRKCVDPDLVRALYLFLHQQQNTPLHSFLSQLLQALLCKCADPVLAKALYLFTTPPKTVLKDSEATLHKLQLVPAAHIYVGIDEKKLQGKTRELDTILSSSTCSLVVMTCYFMLCCTAYCSAILLASGIRGKQVDGILLVIF